MKKEVIDIEVKIDEAIKGVDKLNTSVEGLNETVVDNQKETKKALKTTEKASKSTAQAVSKVGVALKAIGIGLILKAFSLFTDVLSENQKTLDFATTAFNFVSLAVNDLIQNVDAVVGWFKKLGSVVGAVFKGQFAVAAVIMKDAVSDIVDYTTETAKAADEITQLGNRAAVAAAQNRGLVEEFDRQAEQLRQIRDDESKSIEDRIQANKDLGIVLEEQEKAMLANADLILQEAQANYNRNQSIENEVALIEAKNEKLGILAQVEGFRSEQLVNENSLNREKNDLAKEAIELEQERQQQVLDWEEQQEQEIMDAEDERIQREYENSQKRIEIAQAEADAKNIIQNAHLDAVAAGFRILQGFDEESKTLRALGLIADNAVGIAKTIINTQAANTAVVAKYALVPGGAALAAAEITANKIFAGISIGTSIAATAQGLSALGKGGATGSGSRSLGSAQSPTEAQAPDFNIVGSSGTNQLAGAIGQQTQQPVQAFVTSSSVTTAQALDRNIIDSASVG